MHIYYVSYRLGPAADLARHELTIEASSMTDALNVVYHKLYHRFPNYRVISILPMDLLPIEELVDQARSEM